MNPYGQTKIMGEQMLGWLGQSNPDWAIGVLRYFNPAGCAWLGPDRGRPARHSQQSHALCCQGRHRRAGRESPCSARITTRPTAPACAITSMSRTWARGHVPVAAIAGRDRRKPSREPRAPGAATRWLEVIAAYQRACNRELPYTIADAPPPATSRSTSQAPTRPPRCWAFAPRRRWTRCAPVPGPGFPIRRCRHDAPRADHGGRRGSSAITCPRGCWPKGGR